MQITTIDIDRYKIYDKTVMFPRLVKKISKCAHLFKIEGKYSATTNGMHLKLTCQVEKCLICRMSYDDQNRLAYDLRLRQPHERNILFDTYTIFKSGKPINL